jgi:maleylacetate reductase
VRVSPYVYDAFAARVVFGAGTLATVPRELDRLGARRVLLVHSTSARAAASVLLATLGDRLAGQFADIVEHVPTSVAQAAVLAATDARADTVLTIGGGSATGTGKVIARELGVTLACVPTTFAGSEVTPVWGQTVDGRKTTGRDPRVMPRLVVYDPDLLSTLPAAIAAMSAMNAVAHCAEALWHPHGNPVASALADQGLRLLGRAIPALADGRDEPAARAAALAAAHLAGSAFALTGSGLHHALAHALAATWSLPHAATHAVLLPFVAAANADADPDADARIAHALDAPSDGARALRALTRSARAPASLDALGVPPEALTTVAERVAAARVPNPARLDQHALRGVLERAWAGDLSAVTAGTGP